MKMLFQLALFLVCTSVLADMRPNPAIYRAALRTQTEKKQALSTTNTVVKVVQKAIVVTNEVQRQTTNTVNKTTNAPSQPVVVVNTSIKINGSSDFVRRVNEALALLLAKDTKGYELVVSNLKGITENKSRSSSNSYVKPQSAITYILPVDASNIFWLAAALVHEAKHVDLWRTGQVTSGTAGELVCIRRQIETMINIEGPKYFIDYLKSQDGTHWMNATE